MRKLNQVDALNLLYKDVINHQEDLEKEENRWVKHCLYVGIAAGRIAKKLGLDSDYATSLGYIHDIGRKIAHPNHPILGYRYMIEHGFIEEARSCITHNFIDNQIELTAGGGPKDENRKFIQQYLSSIKLNIYDNIIQMCDLFCLATGFTTVEERLLDITKRKGVYPNSKIHLEKTMELKDRLEDMMNCCLYDLFPEISKEALDNIAKDHEVLIKLLNMDKNEMKRKY